MSERKEVLRKVFDNFDTNKSNTIDIKELVVLIRATGETISEEDGERLLSKFDTNKSGVLEFEEFVSLMNTFLMEKIFQRFDQNKDGHVDIDELREVLNNILKQNLTEEAIVEFFNKADTDKDQKINFEEFKAVAAELKIFNAPKFQPS